MTGSDHGQPIVTQEHERAISLPVWPGMTGEDVGWVVEALVPVLDGTRLD